ncbi:MAG: acetate--CoA ligase family protein [Nitrososphaeraceae archaeon]|jgi:3-hydroxypropionyl-CoA synthetase (ADP-forming)|nr:acetate--CoA ligase family protein [Nitrososphaeraceae archaeon]MDW0136221.1 acetate--CoA ligase family protein [Nitrososphaeraceae archaeon]MDW0138727.1 acetate--CoA ligase family protein [Nitrososphaeraceae archaeon]MDW0142938.1 acetate--CoA ligase family protein [Nitrososphaeraceae archaeon]MDW0144093.1 acetate--CoA ligase family protein [Nitrososphaeraceae archaeon]
MVDRQKIQNIVESSKGNPKVITEESSKEILGEYGIRVPKYALVTNSDEAAQKSKEIGFPLVAKIVSPDILHKTDVGGVKVGLGSEDEVKKAFDDMFYRLKEKFDVKGVLLEKMVPKGVELIIGLQNDFQFGPSIMVGLGGIYTELFKDVSFRVLPVTKGDALKMLESLRGKDILKGFRGSKPIDLDMLSEAIVNIGTLGVDMAGKYESIDFNPVVVYPDSYYVVDAKIILKDKSLDNAISIANPDSSYMDLFFNAKSVALIGASPEPGKIGNSVMESLVKHDYKGKVYPVNAKGYSEIMGVKAYKNLLDVKDPVDVVIVTVDLKFVPDLLTECGKKNIHNMVIISGGGKELGGERAAIEKRIQDQSRELNVRIIGPNCIGIFNGENRLDCAFQGHLRMLRPKQGNVAFLSQSGTVGIAFMETSDAFGLSKMISYGNRSDVDEADMIHYLAQDPNTNVIGLYVEGLGDGRKFMNSAKNVIKEHQKPIVVFKNGRSTKGAKQAASHTGSLGGSFAVISGAFEQTGIISVDSYEELTSALKALTWQPVPKGNKIAMVTNGAGPIIAAIDNFERLNLELAQLSDQTMKSFKEHYPATYVIGNPCDVTGSASADDYRFAIQSFLDDPNVDIIMPWFVFQDDPLEEKIVDILADFQKQKKKPILVGAMGGPYTEKISKKIEAFNIPVYQSVITWITAAGSLAKWHRVKESLK